MDTNDHRVIGVINLGKKAQIAVLILTAAVMMIGLIAYIILESPIGLPSAAQRSDILILKNSSVQSERKSTSSETVSDGKQRININTASAEQLMEIDGLGETLAARIIAYRKVHGAFTDIAQLKNIKGIGEKKFEEMKEYITVS
ncbi:MAG: helix-hairpin-helix domain-containing protein [Clostridiales bacterium]|nr:helix-hairpin-helix domain-containing protein [Clostridiales bacterium]